MQVPGLWTCSRPRLGQIGKMSVIPNCREHASSGESWQPKPPTPEQYEALAQRWLALTTDLALL